MRARVTATLAALVVAALVPAAPAAAGGSDWVFERELCEVGVTARAWAAVGGDGNAAFGTPDDGPYFAYLHRADPEGDVAGWPAVLDDAVRVAPLEIHLEPRIVGGVSYGSHHATVEFVVPDVPPGEYGIWHCNDPCTKALGYITGTGRFTIAPRAVQATPRFTG